MQILPNDYIQSQSMYMLCMASQGSTWDAIRTGFGHDLRNTDLALSHVLLTFPQISTIAVSGFSDGASYALGVGLTNVDLFSHILAWSPGFIARGAASFMQSSNPLPKVFIAHGANDSVLPIARCSKRIAIQLRGNGNIIHFEEFAGEHEVPREIAIQALKYWLQDM